MKKFDVTALGELLIDFTDNGNSAQGNTLFEANPGGAPCNVLAMLNQLNHQTAFIGKVGTDVFGIKLKRILEELGIDTGNLVMDDRVNTTLAFVENKTDGERDFSFYRNPGADMMLEEGEVNSEYITNAKIFHFGTLSMTHEGVRKATKKAVSIARENGVLISFDPNIREPLWEDLEDVREQMDYGLKFCDILKISDNEIQWYTGELDYDKAVQVLRSKYNIPLILLTLGKEGSRAYYQSLRIEAPAFLQPQCVETTGAGDTFMGCSLHYILQYGIHNLDEVVLKEMLLFANAAASIITTRKGALRVMPDREEIMALMNLQK